MYKSLPTDFKKQSLDASLHRVHKNVSVKSDFGMDNSGELLDGGFGLFSTANTKKSIGPIKTEYFRIGLIRSGSAEFTIGLEIFKPVRNDIVFGFPGQIFSLQNPSDDFFTYYMLFSEEFISKTPSLNNSLNSYPFLNYSGTQFFTLNGDEATEIESIILKINEEVNLRKQNISDAIRLYIQLILLIANRNYINSFSAIQTQVDGGGSLFTKFLKLVSQHFITVQKVSDYADMLNVSSDHLNRIIKAQSDKTAHELIDEMILREAKAYLMHSELSMSEIAYKLNFSDPSHFNKFFRKLTGNTPLQYRDRI